MDGSDSRRWKATIRDDGILHVVYPPNAQIIDEDAEEVLSWVERQCVERRRPLLVDSSTTRSMTRDARNRYAKADQPAAVAILVSTPTARMIGNFFLGLNQLLVPVRLFSDEGSALTWLNDYL